MAYVGSVLGLLVLAGAVFLALDPLKLSIIAGAPNFKAEEVPLPTPEQLKDVRRDNSNKLRASEVKYGGQVFGPESVVFDSQGRGPYSSVGDGRVMRWDGEGKGWVEFAVIIPNRTDICNQPMPPRANFKYEHLCGRPLGLRFNKKTGDLFIADAYFGLMKVDPEGGVAELVSDGADGQKVKFCNDLDIDHDGTVYFTDSSAKYPRGKFFFPIMEGEHTGRLLKWDPKTKETSVVLNDLRFANGVAFNKDHSFLVIAESVLGVLKRYWVKGSKAGTVEDFVWLPGYPDNVRINDKGEFWVALHCLRNSFDSFFKVHPVLRTAFLKLPFKFGTVYKLFSGPPAGAAVHYSEEGEFLEMLEDQTGEVVRTISEIEEHDGKLYMGSVLVPHVTVYTLS